MAKSKAINPNVRFVDDEEPQVEQVQNLDHLYPGLKSWTPEQLESFKTQVNETIKTLSHSALKAFIEAFVSDLQFEGDVFYHSPQTTEQEYATYFGFNVEHNGVNVHVVLQAINSNQQSCMLITTVEELLHQSNYLITYDKVGKEFVTSHINYVSKSLHTLSMAR